SFFAQASTFLFRSSSKASVASQVLSKMQKLMRDRFVYSQGLQCNCLLATLGNQDDVRQRLVLNAQYEQFVQHMWESIIAESSELLVPVFDTERPIVSTSDMFRKLNLAGRLSSLARLAFYECRTRTIMLKRQNC